MNSSDNKIEELEDLIELAEKVSQNIDTINERVRKSTLNAFTLLFGCIFLCLFGFQYYQMQDLDFRNTYSLMIPTLYSTVIILFSFLFLRLLYSVTSMRESIKNENLILHNLLDMTHSYKQVVYRDLSVVKKAVIDMRLSRIKFNKRIPKNIQIVKKEEVATI